jgi:pantoate--beta-alanine ligase
MQIIHQISEMMNQAESFRREREIVGFVPTMGALHDGHLSLVRASKKTCSKTVVSIFVNPTQFEPNEDFNRYPRDFEKDAEELSAKGCDLIFTVTQDEMYPKGYQTWVDVEKLRQPLCGRFRPHHFRGVTTVVTKLFNIVRPHRAFFGWKDAQQALIIQRMVDDLNMGIEISIQPTIRDDEGLALSSRNQYLSPGEREIALLIPGAIQRAKEYFKKGGKNAKLLLNELYASFEGQKNTTVDYISLVRKSDLESVEEISKDTLLALAVRVGSTRLIDNHLFSENES